MDDLTYGDLERIRLAERTRVAASMEVMGPVMEEAIRMMQPKPDPAQERRHWRRIFAANAMQAQIQHQSLACGHVATLAKLAYETADAMLAHEDMEVPRG